MIKIRFSVLVKVILPFLLAPPPSRIREVLMKFTAWDIVLANLQPGAHTLDGRVRVGGEEYTWKVSLIIEAAASGNDTSASHCPQAMQGLSPFQNACRVYALDPKTGY